ncbi:DNA-binding protein [Clostridium butyricum]|uniref:DNA-binding protein n=1 Tax=Clostridium butyricum TaxID=1492 RepID=UPI0018AAD66C|nr:DNA-binding protein [Clostridium butyricum]MDB2155853.1 DNA-binding protein [Clostridium butyricum]
MHNILKQKKLISVKEFSSEYGFGINKAYKIVNHPSFPKLRYGRKIYIVSSQIDHWIDSQLNISTNNNMYLGKDF